MRCLISPLLSWPRIKQAMLPDGTTGSIGSCNVCRVKLDTAIFYANSGYKNLFNQLIEFRCVAQTITALEAYPSTERRITCSVLIKAWLKPVTNAIKSCPLNAKC